MERRTERAASLTVGHHRRSAACGQTGMTRYSRGQRLTVRPQNEDEWDQDISPADTLQLNKPGWRRLATATVDIADNND